MKILIIQGPPGAGKTTSLRNLPVASTYILRPNDKDLTWPGWRAQGWEKQIIQLTDDPLSQIPQLLRSIAKDRPAIKTVVIEDFTHSQTKRVQSTTFMEEGASKNPYYRWEKFNVNVYESMFALTSELRDDLTVILINHIDRDGLGRSEFKTYGKALGNSTMPTSYSTVVLHAVILMDKPLNERYHFLTHDDGLREAKTPMGMFEADYIPNDIVPVLARIEEYNRQQQVAQPTATPA